MGEIWKVYTIGIRGREETIYLKRKKENLKFEIQKVERDNMELEQRKESPEKGNVEKEEENRLLEERENFKVKNKDR